MANLYTRKYFDSGNGVVIWIAWNDAGRYDVGKTEEEARSRFVATAAPLPWRAIAVRMLMNELPVLTPPQRDELDLLIKAIRDGTESIDGT